MSANMPDFDAETYVRMLVAIAKSDKDNGPREFDFVRLKTRQMGLDFDYFVQTTDKDFIIAKHKVSRLTALTILKDAIVLASLDRSFALTERQRVYTYAEKLDIPRKDVVRLEELIGAYRELDELWRRLVESV